MGFLLLFLSGKRPLPTGPRPCPAFLHLYCVSVLLRYLKITVIKTVMVRRLKEQTRQHQGPVTLVSRVIFESEGSLYEMYSILSISLLANSIFAFLNCCSRNCNIHP